MASVRLLYANQFVSTYLNVGGGVNSTQTTGIILQSVSGIDTTKPGLICLSYSDPLNSSTAEYIRYTSINSTTKELSGAQRGQEGFSAKSHSNQAVAAVPVSESHINQFCDMFDSIGLDLAHISTPTAPSSGRTKIYVKSDGKVYKQDSAGSEQEIGGATTSWTSYSTVVPTRASADDPTYVLTFAGADVTSIFAPGVKIKWTQNSTVRYAIVTKASFSTNSTITVYGGTDYDVDDTATYTISGLAYSRLKAPDDFPLSPAKWTFTTTDSSSRSQSSPSIGTWYNLGSLSSNIPIGVWETSYEVIRRMTLTSGTVLDMSTTLSTANNSESDTSFTEYMTLGGASGSLQLIAKGSRTKILDLSAKTTYYLNAKTSTTTTTIEHRGDLGTTVIKSVCAYL